MAIFFPVFDDSKSELPAGSEFVQDASYDYSHCEDWDAPQAERVYVTKQRAYKLYRYAVGCVVADTERNGYNDSDFYATYYDEASDSFKTVEWGTTRFPCIGCGCTVDATPEILEKYAAWQRKVAEQQAALRKQWALDDCMKACKCDAEQAQRIIDRMQFFSPELRKACYTLLGTRKFRSEFRQSLRNQLDKWLADENPQYATPFSKKQMQYIC